MTEIPCLKCNQECKSKGWLMLAWELQKAGAEVTGIHVFCPKEQKAREVE